MDLSGASRPQRHLLEQRCTSRTKHVSMAFQKVSRACEAGLLPADLCSTVPLLLTLSAARVLRTATLLSNGARQGVPVPQMKQSRRTQLLTLGSNFHVPPV